MVYLPQQGLGGFKTLYGVPDTARMFLTQQGLGGLKLCLSFLTQLVLMYSINTRMYTV